MKRYHKKGALGKAREEGEVIFRYRTR
jgi:hypothetical protein